MTADMYSVRWVLMAAALGVGVAACGATGTKTTLSAAKAPVVVVTAPPATAAPATTTTTIPADGGTVAPSPTAVTTGPTTPQVEDLMCTLWDEEGLRNQYVSDGLAPLKTEDEYQAFVGYAHQLVDAPDATVLQVNAGTLALDINSNTGDTVTVTDALDQTCLADLGADSIN